ncbi:MAG: LysM peptidoglycan-binding domain-containing protein [Verrucomicrobia bacterium]|nr:LysM peptidoglycan-binding domain-containing protein [Verrucomicrobiota bacterium]
MSNKKIVKVKSLLRYAVGTPWGRVNSLFCKPVDSTMQLTSAHAYPDMSGEKSVHDSVMAISRRDTVIIAMLVNMALLFVLFASSVKSDNSVEARPHIENRVPAVVSSKEPPQIATPPREKAVPTPADEIDEILHQYMLKEKQVQPKPIAVKEKPPQNVATPVQAPKTQVKAPPAPKVQPQKVVSTPQPVVKVKKPAIAAPEPVKEQKVAVSEVVPQYYVLKSGDNPWLIARRFHLKFEDLLKLNDLDEEKARNLKVGQKIRIR